MFSLKTHLICVINIFGRHVENAMRAKQRDERNTEEKKTKNEMCRFGKLAVVFFGD